MLYGGVVGERGPTHEIVTVVINIPKASLGEMTAVE